MRNVFTGITVLTLVVIGLTNTFCNDKKVKETAPVSTYLNHHDTVKYVGMQTCKGCHNDIYQSFIQTGMGQSFAPASGEKSAADFSRHHIVYDKSNDLYYHPFKRGDSLFIMEYRLSGRDTVFKRTERVDYIIGSGQHTNSHMMQVNGYVYQLPLTWYAQKKKWDLPPGYENGHNVRFSREIGMECMSCHNAMPEVEAHSQNKFISVPDGIDCERCHGPGEVHVRDKSAGIRIDTATQIDYTIVNPKKLSWERQTDICQRCHLQGNAVLKPGKSFRDFRPGMALADYVDVYMPKYKGRDDEFIMASHAQRLQMSKCFLVSAKTSNTSKLTCITCHNPHVSVKVTGRQVFNNTCINCHNTQSTCKEKPEVRKARNDDCAGCHMPLSGTIDIPHVTVHDHKIQVPAKATDKQKIKEFAGIYCVNNPGADDEAKAKAYLAYYEKFEGEKVSIDSGSFYLARFGKQQEDFLDTKVHYLYLKHDEIGMMQLAQSLKPADISKPWLCYRIGQAYQNNNELTRAEFWYKRATEIAPANLSFKNKYGSVLVQQQKLEAGIQVLTESLALQPKQSEALTNLGFARLLSGDIQSALNLYNKALQLDPDFEQAIVNKAAVLNLQGNKQDARKLLLQVLKRNPNNQNVKDLLGRL